MRSVRFAAANEIRTLDIDRANEETRALHN
jgi:hypothetical protein